MSTLEYDRKIIAYQVMAVHAKMSRMGWLP
jgi:hypothetical protein